MRDPASRIQTLRDLHFALDVMDERSHLGLDDNTARTVRNALLHQILEVETALGFPPSSQMAKLHPEEFLVA